MSILDPFPLHKTTSERTAQAKRTLIHQRAEQLRALADTLDFIIADPPRSDEVITGEANVFLGAS